jgi:hypothetical protein
MVPGVRTPVVKIKMEMDAQSLRLNRNDGEDISTRYSKSRVNSM